jgi:SAM-dependent methyltransferase
MSDRKLYVQYGSGFTAADGWLNLDSSPTLRIERIPIVGSALSALFSGNSQRFPAAVQYGDIRKGLPVVDGSVLGCYASHVLEHLSLEDMREALANTFRMLAPGGVFRLIVPDLHGRASRYVAAAGRASPDAATEFIQSMHIGHERRPRTPMQHLRHLFGGSMHLWMWDLPSMSAELSRAGFVQIRKCEFGDASDPMFAKVENKDRFFDEDLGLAECAIEARRPVRQALAGHDR